MKNIANEMREELIDHILPFWMSLIDKKNGGFYGNVDINLKIDQSSIKSCIINSRILWSFSAVFNQLRDNKYIEFADHAYRFMKEKFIDKKNGGLYLFVDCKGEPIDKRKHINNLSYAIYALVEYFKVNENFEVKGLAIEFFNLIVSKKAYEGYYLEEFDEYWNKKTNEHLDRNGLHADITFNTQIHILECFTSLYTIWPSVRLLDNLKIILNDFEKKMFCFKNDSFNEFFDSRWNSLIDLQIFGHDIEASWLISQTLAIPGVNNSNILTIIERINKNIQNEAFEENSIYLESLNGTKNKTRMWWVQTEAIIGFVNCYQLFGSVNYLQNAMQIWGFIKNYLIDKNPKGEWFANVSEEMIVDQDANIVDTWKGPYHNTRMCLEIMKRLQEENI